MIVERRVRDESFQPVTVSLKTNEQQRRKKKTSHFNLRYIQLNWHCLIFFFELVFFYRKKNHSQAYDARKKSLYKIPAFLLYGSFVERRILKYESQLI